MCLAALWFYVKKQVYEIHERKKKQLTYSAQGWNIFSRQIHLFYPVIFKKFKFRIRKNTVTYFSEIYVSVFILIPKRGVGILLTGLMPPHFCSCPKPDAGNSSTYIVVFFIINNMRWQIVVCFWLYCLNYSSIVWITHLLFELLICCLNYSSVVWITHLLFELLICCLNYSSIVWNTHLLFELLIYCLNYSSIVWNTHLLFEILIYCLNYSSIIWIAHLLFELLIITVLSFSRFWLSYLGRLFLLFPGTFKLFSLPIFSVLCCVVFLWCVCLRPVSCVPNVTSVSGLSIFDCPMLPVSRDCPFLIAQCYQCLGIVHFWLLLRFSLTVIWEYLMEVIHDMRLCTTLYIRYLCFYFNNLAKLIIYWFETTRLFVKIQHTDTRQIKPMW